MRGNLRALGHGIVVHKLAMLALGLGGCGQQVRSAKPVRKVLVAEDINPTVAPRQDWYNLDAEKDLIEGMGVNRVYQELLSGRSSDLAPIVVAVIDSGVDIKHEDLKDAIWVNEGEIGTDKNGKQKETNGRDDDGNGYVDDVYGWNYLGGYDSEGKPVHIGPETLEKTRIFKKLQAQLDAGQALTEDEQALYERVKKQVTEERQGAEDELKVLVPALAEIEAAYPLLSPLLQNKPLDEVTRNEVAEIQSEDSNVLAARDRFVAALDRSGFTSVTRLKRFIEIDNDAINYHYNVDFDPRSSIVGDNPDDFSDVHYGNNDVRGVGADHGTHVAGIIAASRDNALGIRGVARSVKIMSLRAVPNGDERDKDVALAIRYAANNGAHIINMSFGKQFSPHRSEVQDAIEYAEAKGLLLVHAAGNDAKNTTEILNDNFPTPNKIGSEGRVLSWVEVGASASLKGPALPAVFSNFGKKSVDIFSPGVRIESTIPDDKYAIFSGTSMASPAFAGAAALVWSMKPDLSAEELRALLLENGRSFDGLIVAPPTNGDPLEEILFSELSITGRIVDAFKTMSAVLDL